MNRLSGMQGSSEGARGFSRGIYNDSGSLLRCQPTVDIYDWIKVPHQASPIHRLANTKKGDEKGGQSRKKIGQLIQQRWEQIRQKSHLHPLKWVWLSFFYLAVAFIFPLHFLLRIFLSTLNKLATFLLNPFFKRVTLIFLKTKTIFIHFFQRLKRGLGAYSKIVGQKREKIGFSLKEKGAVFNQKWSAALQKGRAFFKKCLYPLEYLLLGIEKIVIWTQVLIREGVKEVKTFFSNPSKKE